MYIYFKLSVKKTIVKVENKLFCVKVHICISRDKGPSAHDETIWQTGGTPPLILKQGTNFKYQPLYPCKKALCTHSIWDCVVHSVGLQAMKKGEISYTVGNGTRILSYPARRLVITPN
jgi:hypothetical protein